jgi:serine/threonine protein kinase
MVSASIRQETQELGPYRLLEVIGQGGMGVVFRGEHRDTGEKVAVKTVRHVTGAVLSGFRKELRVLGQLRHPGVVRLLDEGVRDGLPWYAMELLPGPTLRDHLDSLRVQREGAGAPSWVPTLTLLRRVCTTLAFLHGHGIVHRDLKPENILLRPDGAPVLVDFGLAARVGSTHGREVLEVGGGLVGSDAYMAPEQIRGELVDARADLYALGCILHEAVTGQPPFVDARAGRVLVQHLHRAPVPPSHRVGGLPEALDALVLRLLEKRPEERLGYAEDVAVALCALGAEREAPAPWPRAPAYLHRPGFSGRAEVLRTLRQGIDRARDGLGGHISIRGARGMGKTRLAVEAATEAAWSGLTVVVGECTPPVGAGTRVPALASLPPAAARRGRSLPGARRGGGGASVGRSRPGAGRL